MNFAAVCVPPFNRFCRALFLAVTRPVAYVHTDDGVEEPWGERVQEADGPAFHDWEELRRRCQFRQEEGEEEDESVLECTREKYAAVTYRTDTCCENK